MLNMPASVAISAITFFFLLEDDLLRATLPYSNLTEVETQQEELTTLTNSGGGIIAL